MRDPNRIPTILAALGEYWMNHPDLRLGQIVSNAAASERMDVFFVEDDVMLARLQKDAVRVNLSPEALKRVADLVESPPKPSKRMKKAAARVKRVPPPSSSYHCGVCGDSIGLEGHICPRA